MKELVNLRVTRVDLVARAAVRDPDDPSETSRFLIWKSEDAPAPHANRVNARQVPTTTNQSAAYEAITKAAATNQREGETTEAAISRYVSEHPDAYAAYRAAATPVTKGEAPRNIALEKIEQLAKAERGLHPELTHEQAIAKVAGDKANRQLMADYSQAHYAAVELVAKRDYGKEDALRTLQRLTDEEASRSHVDKAVAEAYVITTSAGREAYRVMLGLGTRERPVLPVSKSDTPYAQLQEVARGLMKSDSTLTEASAMLAACKARGDLYVAYDRALKAEIKAAQSA